MPDPIYPYFKNQAPDRVEPPPEDGEGPGPGPWRHGNLVDLLALMEQALRDPEAQLPHCFFLSRKKIINLLNLLHFLNQDVLLVFRNEQQKRTFSVRGKPHPCQGNRVFCSWGQPEGPASPRQDHRLMYLLVDEGRSLIVIKPEKVDLDKEGISLDLPDQGVELVIRETARYRCPPLPVQLLQEGVVCNGDLVEFSLSALQVKVREDDLSPWQWINPQVPVKVILRQGEELIYSGDGRILKEVHQDQARTIIIRPSQQQIQRVQQREFRTDRVKMNPTPHITFHHPIIRKMVKLPIRDLSISGFAVEEEQATLLPGMIIPELQIEFADLSSLSCRVQVIYRKRLEGGLNKYGLVILSIATRDHWKLSSLLNRTWDDRLDVSGQIDLDSLWRLFFTSGFIYPQKYSHMQVNREHFQELYRKIYLNNPEISRHFTYQEHGIIHGHISMLRVYTRTWMIHHYVSSQDARYKRVGLILLNQIQRHITDSLHIEFPQMEYIICYFRPENKFPSLVFGGAARRIRNPQICSLDTLAYLSYPMVLKQEPLPAPWDFRPATGEDLDEAENYYRSQSGGLMLKALDLKTALSGKDALDETFGALGLKRERHVFALKKKDELKALVAVTATDLGLNLSELTNCSTIVVIDPDDLPFEIFLRVLSQLAPFQKNGRLPVLLYPQEYARTNHIAFERTYQLWAFHSVFSDYYFKYIGEIFSRFNGLNGAGVA